MADSKGFVHSLVSAFESLTALMKAPVGDAGAIANAKQAAVGLSGQHPDVLNAYHEAIVTAVTVHPVHVIPLVEPLVSHEDMKKAAKAHKEEEKKEESEDLTASLPDELLEPQGGARMA